MSLKDKHLNLLRHHAVSIGKWLQKFWMEIAASKFRVVPSSLRGEGNAKNLHANATFITYVLFCTVKQQTSVY
jgi:hypothetical protein